MPIYPRRVYWHHSRMPMLSHLRPWNRGMKKDTRSIQSANMAIQIPSTPKPQYRPSRMPRPTRSVHMDTVETTMVNRVSPAARRAWGRGKEAGYRTLAAMPCIQMI